jgi:hypothetical protein
MTMDDSSKWNSEGHIGRREIATSFYMPVFSSRREKHTLDGLMVPPAFSGNRTLISHTQINRVLSTSEQSFAISIERGISALKNGQYSEAVNIARSLREQQSDMAAWTRLEMTAPAVAKDGKSGLFIYFKHVIEALEAPFLFTVSINSIGIAQAQCNIHIERKDINSIRAKRSWKALGLPTEALLFSLRSDIHLFPLGTSYSTDDPAIHRIDGGCISIAIPHAFDDITEAMVTIISYSAAPVHIFLAK